MHSISTVITAMMSAIATAQTIRRGNRSANVAEAFEFKQTAAYNTALSSAPFCCRLKRAHARWRLWVQQREWTRWHIYFFFCKSAFWPHIIRGRQPHLPAPHGYATRRQSACISVDLDYSPLTFEWSIVSPITADPGPPARGRVRPTPQTCWVPGFMRAVCA